MAAAGVLAAIIAAAVPAAAQGTGAVRGTVTLGEDSRTIDGAMVLIANTGLFGRTSGDGAFEIGNVSPGSWEILAQWEHLSSGRQRVTVVAGETATVDLRLLSQVHEDVTVTASIGGAEPAFEAFNAVTTLESFEVVRDAYGSLGEALQNEPGIASRSFGPGSSRPIIRGFDGDRVLILADGIRTGDLSSSSGDHGITGDPNSAERIEIVRGPATLLYGSNAVGGLVNVISPHESFRETAFAGTRAQLGGDFGSANEQAGTNASLQHSRGNMFLWAGGSARRSGDYDTPEGTIENSATEMTNASAGIGWLGDRLFASGGFTLEDGRHGVPFAAEFHQHDHGHGHEEEGDDHLEEEGEDAHDEMIDLDSRRRVGRFDIGLQNLGTRAIDQVRLSLNVIDWHHDELEIADGIESVGTVMNNRTYLVRADIDQQPTGRLSGRFGVWAQARDFEAAGLEALVPRTDLNSFAAFAYEELSFGRLHLQFGGRVERNDYRTMERGPGGGHGHDDDHGDDDHDDHGDDDHDDHGDDDHDDHDHDALVAPDPRDRDFVGASASVGLRADIGAGSAFVANVTHSHRAPALEELYNFGLHVGNLSFDVGDPDLDAETTLGLDLSLRHQSSRVRGNFNVFAYDIDNFIFGDRTEEVVDDLHVFNFVQGNSRFVGFDAEGGVRLGGQAWATLGLGYVDAKLTDTDTALPRIPPLRGTLRVDLPYGGFNVSPRLMFAARQDNVFRGETETDGYAVFDLLASYVWRQQHTTHILTFTAYNLTNELYRNHTSFIKDLAPEIGRGVKVGYSMRFF